MTDMQKQIEQMGFDAAMAQSLSEIVSITRASTIMECAKIAENCLGGRAHTYTSENAELYRSQDALCELIAAKIRALAVSFPSGIREGKS